MSYCAFSTCHTHTHFIRKQLDMCVYMITYIYYMCTHTPVLHTVHWRRGYLYLWYRNMYKIQKNKKFGK